MHELPVTQSILSIAVDAAQKNGSHRVTAINLVIGELASILDDSVQFYFDILSKDTPAAGAALNFRRLPATAICLDCQHQTGVTPPFTPDCPQCGSNKLLITGGKEFYVESIEVDDDHQNHSGS